MVPDAHEHRTPGGTTAADGAAAAPAAAVAAPPPRRPMRRAVKVLLAIAAAALLYGLYLASLQVMAYTSDAFVATDVVMLAPEVEGRIVAVHVVDNQFVRRGDPLIDLDPTPYALQARLREADLVKAQADEQYAIRSVARAEADLATARAASGLARRTEGRFGDLVKQGAASQLAFDEATTKRVESESKIRAIEATIEAAKQEVLAQAAAVGVAKRALDLARYNLEQTHLVAPIDGHINNLWLRVGDYARTGEPRVGVVASDNWWVAGSRAASPSC
jgi:membrane fusion protein, multidrug efflux system